MHTSDIALLIAGILAGLLAALVLNALLNLLVQAMLDLVKRILEAVKTVLLVTGILALALLAGWGLVDILWRLR